MSGPPASLRRVLDEGAHRAQTRSMHKPIRINGKLRLWTPLVSKKAAAEKIEKIGYWLVEPPRA